MCVSRLYELCIHKYSSSVQLVCNRTVYLYIKLHMSSAMIVRVCVSRLYELSFNLRWSVLGMMLVLTDKDYRKLFPILAHGVNSRGN